MHTRLTSIIETRMIGAEMRESSIWTLRQMRTLQWTPFYVKEELDPDDTHTTKWGDMRHARKWISFEDLQQWHPAFKRDHY